MTLVILRYQDDNTPPQAKATSIQPDKVIVPFTPDARTIS